MQLGQRQIRVKQARLHGLPAHHILVLGALKWASILGRIAEQVAPRWSFPV